jgi:hypothetical protein
VKTSGVWNCAWVGAEPAGKGLLQVSQAFRSAEVRGTAAHKSQFPCDTPLGHSRLVSRHRPKPNAAAADTGGPAGTGAGWQERLQVHFLIKCAAPSAAPPHPPPPCMQVRTHLPPCRGRWRARSCRGCGSHAPWARSCARPPAPAGAGKEGVFEWRPPGRQPKTGLGRHSHPAAAGKRCPPDSSPVFLPALPAVRPHKRPNHQHPKLKGSPMRGSTPKRGGGSPRREGRTLWRPAPLPARACASGGEWKVSVFRFLEAFLRPAPTRLPA